METLRNSSSDIWEITVLKESKDGILFMSPDGDTRFLTHSQYKTYLKNRRERHGNRNLQTNPESKG